MAYDDGGSGDDNSNKYQRSQNYTFSHITDHGDMLVYVAGQVTILA